VRYLEKAEQGLGLAKIVFLFGFIFYQSINRNEPQVIVFCFLFHLLWPRIWATQEFYYNR
jgi:hypothetical protein